jgi:hypothetical protein
LLLERQLLEKSGSLLFKHLAFFLFLFNVPTQKLSASSDCHFFSLQFDEHIFALSRNLHVPLWHEPLDGLHVVLFGF